MRIVFDQGVPAPLRKFLEGHRVVTSAEAGWSDLQNGELLAAAEDAFDVLVTTDKNLRYQQNLAGRKLAIFVLPTTSWPRLRAQVAGIVEGVGRIRSGDYVEHVLKEV